MSDNKQNPGAANALENDPAFAEFARRSSGLAGFNVIPEMTEQDRKVAEDAQMQAVMRKRSKRGYVEDKPSLTLNSLMDIFTNILTYLIMTYSSTPVQIQTSDDLQVPVSYAQMSLKEYVPMTITRRGILVNNEPVMPLTDWKVPPEDLENKFLIKPLVKALQDEAEKEKHLSEINPAREPFDGSVLFIADKEMPTDMLIKLMYTAGRAEFGKFKFIVVKGQ